MKEGPTSKGWLKAKSRQWIRQSTSLGKWLLAGLLGMVLMLFTSVGLQSCPVNREEALGLTGWLVDWHWEKGMEELKEMLDATESVQVFGAYFDHQDRLFVPRPVQTGLEQLRQLGPALYLTVVNDRYLADGSAIQKESGLITRLFSEAEAQARHLEEILELVEAYGFDGVELDYEKVPQETWGDYLQFVEALHLALEQQDKTLRIVLEPGFHPERVTLPKGPVYVMMAYNLYGTHSGPGPKADGALIRRTAEKLKQIPQPVYLALASGGFDWQRGEVRGLTELQAAALARQALGPVRRDRTSGSLFFTYRDEGGALHEVWYADATTLQGWVETAAQNGIRGISLWRLGGLSPESLAYLKTLGEKP